MGYQESSLEGYLYVYVPYATYYVVYIYYIFCSIVL